MDCLRVLMEGTPIDINVNNILEDLLNIVGVTEVHDLHVWSLAMGKPALTAHLVSNTAYTSLKKATNLCKKKYKITHTTIQIEEENKKCKNTLHS